MRRTSRSRLIEWQEDKRVELFNIADDTGESTDLAGQEPQRVASLRAELKEWQKQVNAKFPVPNPAYDAAKPSGRSAKRNPNS